MKKNYAKIPYGLNVYNKEEMNAVLATLKNSTQMGKSVNTFEKKISKLFSKRYGLMVNSGSSAILLALKAINFKKGSEIIVPCLNFGTAISSISLCNLIPIFVDCKIDICTACTRLLVTKRLFLKRSRRDLLKNNIVAMRK